MITVIHTLCLESLEFQVGQKIGNHYNSAINQGVDTRLVSSMDDTYSSSRASINKIYVYWVSGFWKMFMTNCCWISVDREHSTVGETDQILAPFDEFGDKVDSLSLPQSVCLTPECIQIMDKYGLILHLKLSDCYILILHIPWQKNQTFGENVCHDIKVDN